MPNRAKQKGDRAERAIVDLLKSHGLVAYRVPLSGAVNGFKADVELRLKNGTIKLESKVRARGFTRLYKWLEYANGLIIKTDRAEPLLVISLDTFAKLLAPDATLPRDHVLWGEFYDTGYR